MATYTKLYTLVITSASPTGDTVYGAVSKIDDNIDQIITNLNACHMTTTGDIIYRSAGGVTTRLAVGTDGQVVTSNGTIPQWENVGGMTTAGDMIYLNAGLAVTRLAIGTSGQYLSSNGTIPVWASLDTGFDTYANQYGLMQRSIFTYNGGSTAYTVKLKPARYWCKTKYCKWDSEITTLAVSSFLTPAADTRYYLYLDHSAITHNTAIDNGKLIWSVTEPTWDDTYRGWYNGDDRCIFCAATNGTPSNILEFFHDGGDYVAYADSILCGQVTCFDKLFTAVGIDSSDWTTAFLPVPKFCTKATLDGYGSASLSDYGDVTISWKTFGQDGTVGHNLCSFYEKDFGSSVYTSFHPHGHVVVLSNADQKIRVKSSHANTISATLNVDGWYFPAGM